MSNAYFQFRQFTIVQDKCAMKVSTDACIQGAYTPIPEMHSRVLDIGAGTGLLSLMMAQRAANAIIDAIELDEEAVIQAKENAKNSPFADQVNVMQGDINAYVATTSYDLIICNPPFFTNSLLGDTARRNMARHTITLTFIELLTAIKRLLSSDGHASVLLPALQQQQWESLLAEKDFNMHSRLFIKPYHTQAANRVVSIFGPQAKPCTDSELVIYRAQNSYTAAAIQLLSPFYAKEMR
ncbi:MAG: methyltransferase [Flavipsychrobacter sp.]|nr:methyltransferase [Flavipsychrobacter sp.]